MTSFQCVRLVIA